MHEALGDERADRLAHGNPRDPEALGEFTFDQAVAGTQPTRDDLPPQLAQDAFTDRAQGFDLRHGLIFADSAGVLRSCNGTDIGQNA